MKINRRQFKQLIEEEFRRILSEGDVIKGPWDQPPDPSMHSPQEAESWNIPDPAEPGAAEHREESPEEYQYEYVLDELVDAARDGIMPIVINKLKEVGAYRQGVRSNRPGDIHMGAPGLTSNDIELEIEEGLLDALKPLAKIIQNHRNLAAEEDEW